MRILITSLGYFKVYDHTGGGVDSYAYNLANSIAQHGYEVHFIGKISRNLKNRNNENLIIHSIEKNSCPLDTTFFGWSKNYFLSNYDIYQYATRIIKKYEFDLINSHGNVSALFIYRNIKDKGGNNNLVYTFYNPSPDKFYFEKFHERIIRKAMFSLIEKPLWSRVNHIIAISESLKKDLLSFNVDSKKVTVVPTGVDTNIFKKRDYNDKILEKYDLPNYFCLFVGQLVKRKGVKYLLEAIKDIDFNLVVVGGGPQYEYLINYAKKLKIINKVHFLGSVPLSDLIHLYSMAKFFVYPSLAEGGNPTLAILEAMSCELPVIATTASANPTAIKDGYNGFLVPPANVKELRDKINFFVENMNICDRWGKNSRRIAKNKYDWKIIAGNTIKVFKKIVDGENL